MAEKQSERRVERDSMGEMHIPADRLWGAQTQRAIENFPVSGIRFPGEFIQALGLVKWACARANMDLGELDRELGQAIAAAADDVASGKLNDEFPLDIFQTGSGTSTNMNANEVIANAANVALGSKPGSRSPVHPNDHVNLGQSSNDVIPAVIHIAAVLEMNHRLKPALEAMRGVLNQKIQEFKGVVKTGRTHLQDAMPVTVSQEFSGYATQVQKSLDRLSKAVETLRELALGGTAVGTGINRHPDLTEIALEYLNERLLETFRSADNPMEASATRDALVEASGALRTIAVSMKKIGEDIRWLGSGPRNGLGELKLPAVQPGSSIMPGKVNPVIIESMLMVCAHVVANDLAVTLGGMGSRFELNVMMPLMAHNILESIRLLSASIRNMTLKCLKDLKVNVDVCQTGLERNLALATALAPETGYDKAAEISKFAYENDVTIFEAAKLLTELTEDRLNELLEPENLTGNRDKAQD